MTNRMAKPNLPRGVQAFLFEAAARRRSTEESALEVLTEAGLREVLLPVLDFAAPYAGVTVEGDEHVYRFLDRSGDLLALRADFTPMAARVLAPRLPLLGMPLAICYRGDVVRDEEAGVGRPREFAQVGAEWYGVPGFEAEETMLTTLLACLAGLPAARLRVTLGFAGLLPALLSAVAPALAKRKGGDLDGALAEVRERRVLALAGRLLSEGASPVAAREIARSLLVGFDPGSALFSQPVLRGPASALARAAAIVTSSAAGCEVVVDLAGTPDTPYYTGLTVSVDVAGAPAAVAAGGRYDTLLGLFGTPAPALGFSIGVEALASAREAVTSEDELAERPLRIAVGKGRLLAKTLDVLRAGGADFAEPDGRRLLIADRTGAFELLLLKDDDVPTYVAHGGADLGVVGADRVLESGEDVFTPVTLPYGACRLSLIGRRGESFEPGHATVTVGTKYARLAARHFDGRRLAHEIVPLSGSVELAAALRLTDVVVDLVETGGTLAANGLEEIETILESRATLIVGRRALATRRAQIAAFVDGVARSIERTPKDAVSC